MECAYVSEAWPLVTCVFCNGTRRIPPAVGTFFQEASRYCPVRYAVAFDNQTRFKLTCCQNVFIYLYSYLKHRHTTCIPVGSNKRLFLVLPSTFSKWIAARKSIIDGLHHSMRAGRRQCVYWTSTTASLPRHSLSRFTLNSISCNSLASLERRVTFCLVSSSSRTKIKDGGSYPSFVCVDDHIGLVGCSQITPTCTKIACPLVVHDRPAQLSTFQPTLHFFFS
jgi:hypothetical protein